MAATVAAASFSTSSMQSISCIRSHNSPFSDPFLRIASSSRMLQLASINSNPIGPVLYSKWKVPKISASVAQEEVYVVIDTNTEATEEDLEVDLVDNNNNDNNSEIISNSVNTKLYFGNLPYNVDSAQLAGIIQDFAIPELIEVLYDRGTGRSRGFAFVTMSTMEDGNAVIENLDGREYGGRTLRVNFMDKPKPKLPLYPETEYKLFVGNLSWSVTSEILTQAFQEYGNVVGTRVLYDGDSGRSKGYGFVCYETKAEMDIALESLNGVELEGRAMRVSLAEGKKR